jgi:hypothetical protein
MTTRKQEGAADETMAPLPEQMRAQKDTHVWLFSNTLSEAITITNTVNYLLRRISGGRTPAPSLPYTCVRT